MPEQGVLYLVENLTDRIDNAVSLLSLNMHLITKSVERTEQEYTDLLSETGFAVESITQVNEIQFAIKANKK